MKRNGLKRLLLLTLPVVLLPLALYIAAEGQVKSVALFFFLNGLVVAWLECIAVFIYRVAVLIRQKRGR
jgi:hypothetical protein